MSELLADVNKLQHLVSALSDPFQTPPDALAHSKVLVQEMLNEKLQKLEHLEMQYD